VEETAVDGRQIAQCYFNFILCVSERTQNPKDPERHFEHGNPRLPTSRNLFGEAVCFGEASRLEI
jgi:hypothetical protein